MTVVAPSCLTRCRDCIIDLPSADGSELHGGLSGGPGALHP